MLVLPAPTLPIHGAHSPRALNYHPSSFPSSSSFSLASSPSLFFLFLPLFLLLPLPLLSPFSISSSSFDAMIGLVVYRDVRPENRFSVCVCVLMATLLALSLLRCKRHILETIWVHPSSGSHDLIGGIQGGSYESSRRKLFFLDLG